MDKPWTVSRGPIVATRVDVEKAQAINSLLVRPIGILPSEPGDPVLPFALGLFNDIRSLLKPGCGVTVLRRATAAYVYSRRYYFASAQPDAMRHDLDGNPTEPVSAQDRLAAQKTFTGLAHSHREARPAASASPAA